MKQVKQNIWAVSILFFSLSTTVALSYVITPNLSQDLDVPMSSISSVSQAPQKNLKDLTALKTSSLRLIAEPPVMSSENKPADAINFKSSMTHEAEINSSDIKLTLNLKLLLPRMVK